MMCGDKMWAEYELAKEKEPILDSIYKLIWPGCSIDRHQKDGQRDSIRDIDDLKDKEGGIDVTVRLKDGTPLTFQEKTRRASGKQCNSFLLKSLKNGKPVYDLPLERWNVPPSPQPIKGPKPMMKKKGEYYNAFPQFHIVFYDYNSLLSRWYIINTSYFRDWFSTENKVTCYPSKYVHKGMCSFHAIPIEDLIKECPYCIFYDSQKMKDGKPIKLPYLWRNENE